MEKNSEEIIDIVEIGLPKYNEQLGWSREILGISKDMLKFSEANFPDYDHILLKQTIYIQELSSLICISLMDLFVVCKGLMNSVNTWEKIYFIKNGYLLIYETINLYEKRKKDVLPIIGSSKQDIQDEFQKISLDLKNFKKTFSFEGLIGKVRNTNAGHIHIDFIKYFDTLKEIKGENDTQAIITFLAFMKKMEAFLTKLAIDTAVEPHLDPETVMKSLSESRAELERQQNGKK